MNMINVKRRKYQISKTIPIFQPIIKQKSHESSSFSVIRILNLKNPNNVQEQNQQKTEQQQTGSNHSFTQPTNIDKKQKDIQQYQLYKFATQTVGCRLSSTSSITVFQESDMDSLIDEAESRLYSRQNTNFIDCPALNENINSWLDKHFLENNDDNEQQDPPPRDKQTSLGLKKKKAILTKILKK